MIKKAIKLPSCTATLYVAGKEYTSKGKGQTIFDAIVNALELLKPDEFHTSKGIFNVSSGKKVSNPVALNFIQMKKLFVAGGMTSDIHRLTLAKRLAFFL